MSYPVARSMLGDLSEGQTDGKYKKVVNNRGMSEHGTVEARKDLYDRYYGIHEAPIKEMPDGLASTTPNYVATAPALPY